MTEYSRKSEYEMRVRKDKTLAVAKYFPEPLTRFFPPKKSTVKLWIKGEERFWNPENKVEYP